MWALDTVPVSPGAAGRACPDPFLEPVGRGDVLLLDASRVSLLVAAGGFHAALTGVSAWLGLICEESAPELHRSTARLTCSKHDLTFMPQTIPATASHEQLMTDKAAAPCGQEAILPSPARDLVPRRLRTRQRGRMPSVEVAAPQQDPLISACGRQAAAILRESSSQHSALMCA